MLDRLYSAISDVTGCSIIVDSSKSSIYAPMLRLVPSIDVFVVHLVRDPRGVQQSLIRRKESGDARYADHSNVRSTLRWSAKNAALEMLGVGHADRYLRLRYEDFIADPSAAFKAITALIGRPTLGTPQLSDGSIHLKPNHIMAGSPNRRDTGAIRLGTDNRWMTEMDTASKQAIARWAFPLLGRYGYASQSNHGTIHSATDSRASETQGPTR